MDNFLIYRSLYGILFLLAILPRMRSMRKGSAGSRHDNAMLNIFGMICMVLFFSSTLQYVFWPESLGNTYFLATTAMHYGGAALALIGCLLMIGAEKQLGKQFSQYLEIREDHQLIDNGFYRYIRHPIYSAYIPLFSGFILLSANMYIAFVLAMILTYCILRIPREEQMMLETFGDIYRRYQQRTKRLIPLIY